MNAMEFSFEDLESCETCEEYLAKRFEGLKIILRTLHEDAVKESASTSNEMTYKRIFIMIQSLESSLLTPTAQIEIAIYLQIISAMAWKNLSFEQAMEFIFTQGVEHMAPETKALVEHSFKMAKAIFAQEIARKAAEAETVTKH